MAVQRRQMVIAFQQHYKIERVADGTPNVHESNLSRWSIDHGRTLGINELSIGWHCVLVFPGKPLFVLGDAPLSPIRFLSSVRDHDGFAVLTCWRASLQTADQRRTTPLAEGSANALGRIVAVAAWFFCYLLVPEAKGKTLEQIKAHWRSGKSPREL